METATHTTIVYGYDELDSEGKARALKTLVQLHIESMSPKDVVVLLTRAAQDRMKEELQKGSNGTPPKFTKDGLPYAQPEKGKVIFTNVSDQ